MGIEVPKGYVSKDVIDRTNGEAPTLRDKLDEFIVRVRDDWQKNISKPTPVPMPGLDDNAVARIHARLQVLLGNGPR